MEDTPDDDATVHAKRVAYSIENLIYQIAMPASCNRDAWRKALQDALAELIRSCRR